jgi:hypothetical protein
MTGWRVFVRGVGVGATASYFLDPDEGPRRRALFRERVADWTRRGLGELEADLGDVTRRLAGVVATIRRIARGTPPRIDDQAIAERLATQLGRLEHPDSVTFDVRERRVHLRGVVLPRDAERARRAVRRALGARELVDELDVHRSADVPALQAPPRGLEPATRLAMGALVTAALAPVARRVGPVRTVRTSALATFVGAVASVERTRARDRA